MHGELGARAVEPVRADRFETDRPHRAEMNGNGVARVEFGQETGGALRSRCPEPSVGPQPPTGRRAMSHRPTASRTVSDLSVSPAK